MEYIKLSARDSRGAQLTIKELKHNTKTALTQVHEDYKLTGVLIPRGLPKLKLWAIAKAMLSFTPPGPRQGSGHPSLRFNYKRVLELAAKMCTDVEMAQVLNCSVDAITQAKKNNPKFIRAYYGGQGKSRLSLRGRQWSTAMGEVEPEYIKHKLGELQTVIKSGIPPEDVTLVLAEALQQLMDDCDGMRYRQGGHPGMQIFLGKNYLQQADSHVLETKTGKSAAEALEQAEEQIKGNPELQKQIESELSD